MNRFPDHDDDLAWRERLHADAPMPQRTPDLWPGIAAQLPAEGLDSRARAGSVPAAALRSARVSRWRRRRAVAASLLASVCLLALIALGLPFQELARVAPSPMAQTHPLDTLLLREAEGLEREYAAVFAQFEGAPLPAALQPGLQALDVESQRIHAALAEHPRQSRLLDELRRLHQRRLDLLLRGIERNV